MAKEDKKQEQYVEASKLSPEDFALDLSEGNDDEEIFDEGLDIEDEEDKDEKPEETPDEEEEQVDEDLEEEEDDEEPVDQEEDSEDPGEDEEEDAEPARVVDTIAQTLGYEFDEEELAELEDNEEGIAKLTDMAAQHRFSDLMEGFMEEHPLTRQVFEYEKSGGDPNEFRQTFFPETDYTQVELSEDDISQQKQIVRESLRESGMQDSRINRVITTLEDSGELYEESQDALSQLRENQKEQKQQLVEQQKQQEQKQIEQAKQAWQQVQGIIEEKSEIAGIPLPKAQKDKFTRFLTDVDEDGLTPRNRKAQELSLEEAVAIDLIMFYGFDGLEKMMSNRMKTSSTKTLREKIDSQGKKKKSDDHKSRREVKDVDLSELDLDFASAQ